MYLIYFFPPDLVLTWKKDIHELTERPAVVPDLEYFMLFAEESGQIGQKYMYESNLIHRNDGYIGEHGAKRGT